jgi:glycerol kinase
MDAVIALDAGTTSVRAVAFDERGAVVATAREELAQHFPGRGLVEHDPARIWALTETVLADVVAALREADGEVRALGITNQRETAVAWNRADGTILHPAIVWQDRRTAERCDALREAGHLPFVRERTGLVLDPYFSATKWAWMLEHGGVERSGDLALGTVDSWVVWNLTAGDSFVTDVSNASRTSCLDIHTGRWSEELCDLFAVPIEALPEVRPSCGRLGTVSKHASGGVLAGVPISGLAGDQQAALFGQGCFQPGETKATYGTGTFVLMNVGRTPPPPVQGLLTTIAWDLGEGREYALEGAIFATGATIQWLRDGLEIIPDPASAGPLAASVPSTEGVYIVPAFAGLGSPWWDPYARGALLGVTRGSGRAHLARAAVEAAAYQTRDVVEAMRSAGDRPVRALAADGGAAVMDLLLQLQADQLRCPVVRRTTTEVTALGAAFLAGIAEGVWSGPDEVRSLLKDDAVFEPVASAAKADTDYGGWLRAVERARHWETVAAPD